MDGFHRERQPDTRTARPCSFCMRWDSDFARRRPWDQLVQNTDKAAEHLSEEGHVRHRMLELSLKNYVRPTAASGSVTREPSHQRNIQTG